MDLKAGDCLMQAFANIILRKIKFDCLTVAPGQCLPIVLVLNILSIVLLFFFYCSFLFLSLFLCSISIVLLYQDCQIFTQE